MAEDNGPAKPRSTLVAILALGVLLVVGYNVLAPNRGFRSPHPRLDNSRNCLRSVALAVLTAEVENRGFPAAVVRNADGNPLYSWRVTLLPYLDQRQLFEKFAKDEPWDGPHNAALLASTPTFYRVPSDTDSKAGDTSIVALVGDGTVWSGIWNASFLEEPPEMVLLAMVAETGIKWSEPRDFTPAELLAAIQRKQGPGPHLIGRHALFAAFADGSIRQIDDLPADELEAMLTRAGDEAIVLP